MPDYFITSENNPQDFRDQAQLGSIKTYQFDFSQWAEENTDLVTVTWTVKSGQVTITGQALAANVANAQIAFPESGGSLVEIKAETGTETYIAILDLLTIDPRRPIEDYGLCSC